MFPKIDAHQHIWDPKRAKYDWLGPDFEVLNRSFTFEELLPSLHETGIDFTIQVQSADNVEDTELMQESANSNPEVVGIVGFAPIHDATLTEKTLETWAQNPLMVGVRNLIHNIPDPEWLLRQNVRDGLSVLAEQNYTFDVVSVLPEHLALLPQLSERHPDLKMVIDHLSKPPIGLADMSAWKRGIEAAAENPNVYAKVSGLYSSVGELSDWTTDAIRPAFEFAFEVFGPERLMYGGDWPISKLAGDYVKVWQGLNPLFNELSENDSEYILGRTAYEFYGLSDSRLGLE